MFLSLPGVRLILCALVLLLVIDSAYAQAPLADQPSALYAQKCTNCHNLDGTPKKIAKDEGAPSFVDASWTSALEEIEQTIIKGKGMMPKFRAKLRPEQIRALAEYVMAFRTARQPPPR